MTTKSTKVPKGWEGIFAATAALTDRFCDEHLDREYADMARCAIAALCRKRPSPLTSGHQQTWACAVLYALGQINFLHDKSTTPYMAMADLCGHFGIASSTGGTKAKLVRKALSNPPLISGNALSVTPTRLNMVSRSSASRPIGWHSSTPAAKVSTINPCRLGRNGAKRITYDVDMDDPASQALWLNTDPATYMWVVAGEERPVYVGKATEGMEKRAWEHWGGFHETATERQKREEQTVARRPRAGLAHAERIRAHWADK
jgi:hypothetical protein